MELLVKWAAVLVHCFRRNEFSVGCILSCSLWLASHLFPIGTCLNNKDTLFCRCGLTGTVTALVWTFALCREAKRFTLSLQ